MDESKKGENHLRYLKKSEIKLFFVETTLFCNHPTIWSHLTAEHIKKEKHVFENWFQHNLQRVPQLNIALL